MPFSTHPLLEHTPLRVPASGLLTPRRLRHSSVFSANSVQSRRQSGLQLSCVVHAAAEEQSVSYAWSWQHRGRSHLPTAESAFDQHHQLTAQPDLQAIMGALEAAAAACEASSAAGAAAADSITADGVPAEPAAAAAAPQLPLPSQSWLQQVLVAAQPLLQQSDASDTVRVLQLLSRIDFTPDSSWLDAVLQGVCDRVTQLGARGLTALVWSLSELGAVPTQQHWQALLAAAQVQLQDMYGPDLALLVCGAGSIYSNCSNSFNADGGARQPQQQTAVAASGTSARDAASTSAAGAVLDATTTSSSSSVQLSLPSGWGDAVLNEVCYQVTEFPSDLGAFDLARLASGLADLGLSPSSALQDRLLKAVYMRTRTIEEKGAVDFALAKLDAKGKKSMHYDPRWTHEELKWLPRRERDKWRILKEGWVRTQWTGWQR